MIRLLVITLALPALMWAQPLRWTTYTSTSNVVDVAAANGQVWAVTSGGLSGFDPGTNTFDVYTNTRGLAMNNSQATGRDSRGWIWVGHQNGDITRIDPPSGAARIIEDLRGEVFEFTTILDVGSEEFVAANNGIYRLSYSAVSDNYRILEAIRDLGAFPGEARVADLAATADYIYAGTTFGLARARLDEETLSAPDRWETFTATPGGLPENDLRAVFAAADGTLWIATEGHIARFDGSTFTVVSATAGVIAFAEREGMIYAATSGNVFRIDGNSVTPFGQALPRITDLISLTTSAGSELVVGMGDSWETRGGLSFFETDHWTDPVRAAGICSNTITEVAVDPQGRVWAGGADAAGLFVIDGESITNYASSPQHPQPFFGATPTSFAFDDFGGAWAGSEGGGVAWFHGDDITFFYIGDSSGYDGNGQPRLAWTSFSPGYLVTAVTRNASGDVYIINRASSTNRPLARVSSAWIQQGNNPEPWLYYTPYPSGWDASFIDLTTGLVDSYERVWLGSHPRQTGRSNWVFDDRGTPADSADDDWFRWIPSSLQDPGTCFDDLLTGVTSWDIDSQGYLWIGAHNGAYYTQAGIPGDLNGLRFVCVYDLPIGQSVNAVHVDANDNKWFGTDDGVAVMDKNFTWVHVFKTADAEEHRSGLASNAVTSIASNPETGDVWIGTTDGLSRLQSPYVKRAEGLSDLKPYPNPFVADGTHRMFISHQDLGGVFDELRVYTLSGRLVRRINWSQAINPNVGWDGRNGDGELVAGGVYLLVVSATDGSSATGKVAVLGK